MRRKSRTPLIAIILIVVLFVIGFLAYKAYDGRMRESLMPAQITASNASLDTADSAVQQAAKVQAEANTALQANPADLTLMATWSQATQSYQMSLNAYAKKLQERLAVETHLGTTGDKLRLQLLDMQGKLAASSVGGSSFESLMSAEANLASAASDGVQLRNSIAKIK